MLCRRPAKRRWLRTYTYGRVPLGAALSLSSSTTGNSIPAGGTTSHDDGGFSAVHANRFGFVDSSESDGGWAIEEDH